MCAVGGLIHPMALLQQFKQLLNWDARVRWAAQRENLPQQHPVRPPEMQEKSKLRGDMTHQSQEMKPIQLCWK